MATLNLFLLHSRPKISLFQLLLQKTVMILNTSILFLAISLKKNGISMQFVLEFFSSQDCFDPINQEVLELHLLQFRERKKLINLLLWLFFVLFCILIGFVGLLISLDIKFEEDKKFLNRHYMSKNRSVIFNEK